MPKFLAPKRISDHYGQGHYLASRGDRRHKGQDFLAVKDSICLSDVSGEITKHGYPYKDHLQYRYVQVTTKDGHDVRYFYIHPILDVGTKINKGDLVGIVQDLEEIYPDGMKNHVHFEVKKDGVIIDPNKYLHSL